MRTFIVLLAVAGAGILAYLARPYVMPSPPKGAPDGAAGGTIGRDCASVGGTWIAGYAECEGAGESWCADHDGAYNDCASPCRHGSGGASQADCNTTCVKVCVLGAKAGAPAPGPSPTSATYHFGATVVTLKDGRAGDGTPVVTRTFGQKLGADVDGDGKVDTLLFLVRDNGNVHEYYVVAAMRRPGGYVGTEGVDLGDRIAFPQMTFKDGKVVVTYEDRYPWQDMDAEAEVHKTLTLHWDGSELAADAGPQLDHDTARRLAVAAWGDCSDGSCTELRTRATDDGGGIWYVESVRDGLKDDSIKAVKRIAMASYAAGTGWTLGDTLLEVRECQAGRGHAAFSDQPCR